MLDKMVLSTLSCRGLPMNWALFLAVYCFFIVLIQQQQHCIFASPLLLTDNNNNNNNNYWSQDAPPYQTFWIDQKVDHFNLQTQPQTFKQRYLVNDQFWVPPTQNSTGAPGPIFFYTGNEEDVVSFWKNSGFVFELAAKFGAYVVFAEHRYYGQSLPFGKQSWEVPYIGLLSVEQALADFATLIEHLKATLPGGEQCAVAAFGGSYGGMLSAWIRIKYPNVVDMALAASAPILWGTGATSASGGDKYPGYFETVTKDFARADSRCPGLVRRAFVELLDMSHQPNGMATITNKFSLCTPLKPDQVEHLILWTVNSFGSLAMMDYPYPTGFLAPLPAWPVNVACSIMLQHSNDLLKGLAQASGLFYNGTTGNLKCFNITSEFVECADQTGCGTGPGGLSWDYQACTEIIYFPNTNNVTDMFPPRNWTASDLTTHCQKKWNITPRLNWMRTYTGGANIQFASRIIFSNGLLDPWHGGGFLESLSHSLVAVIIADGAHHLDLRGSNPKDPESVIRARREEAHHLEKWLKEVQEEKKQMK